ncbi:ribonuclease HII [Thermogladius sp. 4427co]|uniref:ribonuclease HII n=1 Tax=Thermogladius sp. 4427co TaxID=3450718 RepID=UPI003F79EFB3
MRWWITALASRPRHFEKIVAGLDEAGRGPLLGDMVVAGVFIPSEYIKEIQLAGAADSKQLTPSKRLKVRSEISQSVPLISIAVYLSPWEIDRTNLNKATLRAMMDIIATYSSLFWNREEVEIYVDEVAGVSRELKAFCKRVFGEKLKAIVVEADADAKYPAVSLASIIAKTFRDESIEPGRIVYGDYGSGYSTDPRTIEWVRKNYYSSKPPIVRSKWKNLKHLAPKWYIGSRSNLLDYFKKDAEHGNESPG